MRKTSAELGLATALSLAASGTCLHPAAARAEDAFSTNARAAVLMDAHTGAILFQHNANQLLPPASMSKLLTIALVFDALKSGRLSLDDEFTVSENAWRKGGAPSRTASMFVPINTKASIRDLVQGMIVQSGNDAAIAIAEGIAGSETEFASLMTRKARELGLKRSTFRNATGLDEDGHVMTARELAMLARAIIQLFPDYYGMFSQREMQYRKHKFVNRNPLLSTDIGADGLKTGYLQEAGYGLVASAVKGSRRLIVVVMGLKTANSRKSEIPPGCWSSGSTKSPPTGFLMPERPSATRGSGVGATIMFRCAVRENCLSIFPTTPQIRTCERRSFTRLLLNRRYVLAIRSHCCGSPSPTQAVNEIPLYAAIDVAPANVLWRGLDASAFLLWRWLERWFDDLTSMALGRPDERATS